MVPPFPYSVESEEYDLIFYMMPDNYEDVPLGSDFDSKSSGLYIKSTSENIYTFSDYFDDYYYDSDLYFSKDMGSFAASPWPEWGTDRVITFYGNGSPYKYYKVTDLMKNPEKREWTAGHYFWLDSIEHNEENDTLRIVTLDGVGYLFDLNTGDIISQNTAGTNPTGRLVGTGTNTWDPTYLDDYADKQNVTLNETLNESENTIEGIETSPSDSNETSKEENSQNRKRIWGLPVILLLILIITAAAFYFMKKSK
ncbi:hypothetical protein [Methanimicrococcus hongohii]|nr:hypothetical protein [Methanimicrococcus sp. Hf6]